MVLDISQHVNRDLPYLMTRCGPFRPLSFHIESLSVVVNVRYGNFTPRFSCNWFGYINTLDYFFSSVGWYWSGPDLKKGYSLLDFRYGSGVSSTRTFWNTTFRNCGGFRDKTSSMRLIEQDTSQTNLICFNGYVVSLTSLIEVGWDKQKGTGQDYDVTYKFLLLTSFCTVEVFPCFLYNWIRVFMWRKSKVSTVTTGRYLCPYRYTRGGSKGRECGTRRQTYNHRGGLSTTLN